MKNCGAENFTIEIIKECSTQEQANERERFWIKVLKCKIPNGYNQKDDGSVGYYRQQKVHKPILKSLPKMNALDLLPKEKCLNFREKLLIGSIIDLPRLAREAVIDWAFKLIIAVEAQTTEEEREAQIRDELERSITEQQAKLDKLKGETSSYVEDASTGAGWNSKPEKENNFSWKKSFDNIKSPCRPQRDLPFKGGEYDETSERLRLGYKVASPTPHVWP